MTNLARKYPALAGESWRNSDPVIDQIHAPMLTAKADGKEFSPAAYFHPDISRELEAVHDLPASQVDSTWLDANGFSFKNSNLAERRPDGTTELNPSDRRQNSYLYAQALDALDGPVGVPVLILHDPAAPLYAAPPTFTPTVAAVSVTYGWSVQRIARFLMHGWSSQCYWTGKRTQVGNPKLNCNGSTDWGLLVSCGGRIHLFPTCDRCRWEFSKDVTKGGWPSGFHTDHGKLDYVENDGWMAEHGWPADQFA